MATPGTPRGGITFAEPDFDDHTEKSSDGIDDKKEESSEPAIRSKKDKNIKLKDAEFRGPSHHMNPTSARMSIARGGGSRRQSTGLGELPPSSGDPIKDFEFMWRSRDNRKGSVAVPVSPRGGAITMRMVFNGKDAGKGMYRMLTFFPYWDMSFWSGWTYTVGSILFVIDGFWSWLPLVDKSLDFPGNDKYGVPLAFFFGALFYQVGAVMAYFEAINDGSFAGSAMKRLLLGHDREAKEILDKKLSNFFGHIRPGHHDTEEEEREKRDSQVDPEAGWRNMNRRGRQQSVYTDIKRPAPRRGGLDMGEPEEGESVEYLQWRWWPTWHRLRTHHIYEIGYLSCAIQLFGVTLYGMTSIVILPGILSSLNHWQENAAYWIPQIVAATCFLVASFGFMWETQVKWWKPEFGVLGWWIGFWSVVGSVGFLLCAVFGISSYTNTGLEYQADLSTTWGSIAYLTGSALQWYEAVNKHSVADLLGDNEVDAPMQPVGDSERQPATPAAMSKQQSPATPAPLSTQTSQQTPLSPMAHRDFGQPDGGVRDPNEVERQLTK